MCPLWQFSYNEHDFCSLGSFIFECHSFSCKVSCLHNFAVFCRIKDVLWSLVLKENPIVITTTTMKWVGNSKTSDKSQWTRSKRNWSCLPLRRMFLKKDASNDSWNSDGWRQSIVWGLEFTVGSSWASCLPSEKEFVKDEDVIFVLSETAPQNEQTHVYIFHCFQILFFWRSNSS